MSCVTSSAHRSAEVPSGRATLIKTYQEATGCTDSAAAAWADEVQRCGRYVPDVFS